MDDVTTPPEAEHEAADPRVVRSRSAVLTATLELLTERGIAHTTIEAVSARSGVAKTTIYRQWSGQAALVLDAFDSLLGPPVTAPDTGQLREDLLRLVRDLADALAHSPAAGLMPALLDAAERDPAFAELHRRETVLRHAPVRAVLSRGIARGELPAGTDLDVAVDLLAGPLFHRRWVTGGRLDPDTARTVVDVVLHGLGARTAGQVGLKEVADRG